MESGNYERVGQYDKAQSVEGYQAISYAQESSVCKIKVGVRHATLNGREHSKYGWWHVDIPRYQVWTSRTRMHL